jgi:organic hydroperoxide reductase OsmC/OhrA
MKFSARVQSSPNDHQVTLRIGDREQTLAIPPRPSGGSSVSGGELLFLALATCYCNDIYREAAKRDIKVESLEVDVEGDFEAEGKPASNIVYRARIKANASQHDIHALMLHTDTVTEIQNTVRANIPVLFEIQ